MTLGEKITTMREQFKWSQEDLSKKIGVSIIIIELYENGEIIPSIKMTTKIAQALGVSLDSLVTNNDLSLDTEFTISNKQRFKIIARLKSFKYAFSGINHLFRTQHNFRFQISLTFFTIILGYLLNISLSEWCYTIFAIGFVLSAEAFNTALEVLTDFVSPQYNEKAKIIKDLGAAAVLLSALTAFIVGMIIFLPKFWN
jgi:undecaprenol kinase/diacylglycerol kinase (ATP)